MRVSPTQGRLPSPIAEHDDQVNRREGSNSNPECVMRIAIVQNTIGIHLETVSVVSVLQALFISLRPWQSFVPCQGPLEGQLLEEDQIRRAIELDLLSH